MPKTSFKFSEIEGIMLSGEGRKADANYSSWKARFFVLTKDAVYYFPITKSKDYSKSVSKGCISLKDSVFLPNHQLPDDVLAMAKKHNKDLDSAFMFGIQEQKKKRVYPILMPDQDTYTGWVYLLQMLFQLEGSASSKAEEKEAEAVEEDSPDEDEDIDIPLEVGPFNDDPFADMGGDGDAAVSEDEEAQEESEVELPEERTVPDPEPESPQQVESAPEPVMPDEPEDEAEPTELSLQDEEPGQPQEEEPESPESGSLLDHVVADDEAAQAEHMTDTDPGSVEYDTMVRDDPFAADAPLMIGEVESSAEEEEASEMEEDGQPDYEEEAQSEPEEQASEVDVEVESEADVEADVQVEFESAVGADATVEVEVDPNAEVGLESEEPPSPEPASPPEEPDHGLGGESEGESDDDESSVPEEPEEETVVEPLPAHDEQQEEHQDYNGDHDSVADSVEPETGDSLGMGDEVPEPDDGAVPESRQSSDPVMEPERQAHEKPKEHREPEAEVEEELDLPAERPPTPPPDFGAEAPPPPTMRPPTPPGPVATLKAPVIGPVSASLPALAGDSIFQTDSKKIVVYVERIKCEMCAQQLEAGLLSVPGVSEVSVNISLRQITISFGLLVANQQLITARLIDMGFMEQAPGDVYIKGSAF
ncbi:Heavy-metal-associated domain [Carpediemonas membranifera]|uniref:Heavy-metal-associated domain n=1 Tax=Carpediemonas membranifera TaxID=201153 RepID=A0A8J6E5K4_9EUKA|nr:Heavy-metal-associated domain [Carpediemonas membranifera]|eukprot:KAG9395887.1 Heavy-metal-associated domain [Carpediemonas membranifera]